MDFQKGDKVFSFRRGNGEVVCVSSGSYPIAVEFTDGDTEEYTSKGLCYSDDLKRELFHGHDLEFSVNEILPKREVSEWVIRYSSGQMSTKTFDSLGEAKDFNRLDKRATYHEIKVVR